MALPHILEGTWEEIKLHDAELAGRFLRIILEPDIVEPDKVQAKEQLQPTNGNGHISSHPDVERLARIKSLRGKYAHLGVSVNDLHHERAADKAREELLLQAVRSSA